MMKKNIEEQAQMDKGHIATIDKNLYLKVIKKIMSEREGILTLPENLEDAIAKVMDFVEFEPIQKSLDERDKVSDVKEEFFYKEFGKILIGYKLGGVGIKSDIDADDWLKTVIREFIITSESELLVLEATNKSHYCEDCDFTYRKMERVISKNQTLSCWEKEYIFDKLNWKIKIQDSLNQLEEEFLADCGH